MILRRLSQLKTYLIIKFAKTLIKRELPLIKSELDERFSNLFEIRMVFGTRSIYSTVICLKSFYTQSSLFCNCFVHSDGSLTNSDITFLKHHIPWIVVIKPETLSSAFSSKYPHLDNLRKNYYGKKLVDTLYYRDEKKKLLILDDDIIFFKQPIEIINWIKNEKTNIFMQDYASFVNLSAVEAKSMLNITRSKTPVNTGILGLTDSFRFSEIEKIIKAHYLIVDERRITEEEVYINAQKHLTEQSTFWLLISMNPKKMKALPYIEYVVFGYYFFKLIPKYSKGNPPTAIHFAGDSTREIFFKFYLNTRLHWFKIKY